MTGNPKESKWFSAPGAARRRKAVGFTLSDEARERLDKIAKARKRPKSQIIEELILACSIRER